MVNLFAFMETQFNAKIKYVKMDNGKEFNMLEFFAAKKNIHKYSRLYTPQQNGVVERKHQHIMNVIRSLNFQASLIMKF